MLDPGGQGGSTVRDEGKREARFLLPPPSRFKDFRPVGYLWKIDFFIQNLAIYLLIASLLIHVFSAQL